MNVHLFTWLVGPRGASVTRAPPSVAVGALGTGSVVVGKLNKILELGDLHSLVGLQRFYFTS